ncbi:LysM peptidoglycan-binding domain-containing protein [Brevibacillus sp. SYSU BS000544]|uniref:LysM peptidoglycan-binding domain-containing protein n=1 Tax=Brevibacillus sp. SYSU BS000544 TaxID=3416443 RepID=UPI003CE4A6B7
MSLQDGLLSFQIKETIFLSSDKADIGQIKELELIPDVEIIENTHEISITGCLQLYGRYEGGKNLGEDESGGTDSLLEAMKFTPFQLQGEESKQYLLDHDVELTHRIPLNVSIPLSRIEELGEIYAIVDSFDYEVKTPHQLQIQADLKISGIFLKGLGQEQVQEESAISPPEEQEKWEFVHVVDTQDGHEGTPSSIEEIERKLAELEREVAAREQKYNQPYTTTEQYLFTPYVAAEAPSFPYFPPYQPEPANAQQEEEPVIEEYPEVEQAVANTEHTTEIQTDYQSNYQSNYQTNYQTENEAVYQPEYQAEYQPEYQAENEAVYQPEYQTEYQPEYQAENEAVYQPEYQVEYQPDYQTENEAVYQPEYQAEYQPEYQAEYQPDYQIENEAVYQPEYQAEYQPEYQHVNQSEDQIEFEAQTTETYDDTQEQEEVYVNAAHTVEVEAEAEEAHEDEEAVLEAETVASEEDEVEVEVARSIPEQKEMKVAISSKPTKEIEAAQSITSLFSNARRSKAEQASEVKTPDASSASGKIAEETAKPSVSVLRNNLGAFSRDSEQKFSRLKLCIIQRDETIQTIAERYSLPVSRIVEVNHLSTDRVVEGQVLYIPQ